MNSKLWRYLLRNFSSLVLPQIFISIILQNTLFLKRNCQEGHLLIFTEPNSFPFSYVIYGDLKCACKVILILRKHMHFRYSLRTFLSVRICSHLRNQFAKPVYRVLKLSKSSSASSRRKCSRHHDDNNNKNNSEILCAHDVGRDCFVFVRVTVRWQLSQQSEWYGLVERG